MCWFVLGKKGLRYSPLRQQLLLVEIGGELIVQILH